MRQLRLRSQPKTEGHDPRRSRAAAVLVGLSLLGPSGSDAADMLPARVRRIVLHTLGGPSYERPEKGFVFYDPLRTQQQIWRRRNFGTQWILWTDGTLWPRHPAAGEPAFWTLPVGAPADAAWRQRLARQAAPPYAHVRGANEDSVGIEVAHSGRSGDPFPPAQVRALAWLLETLTDMSGGRLRPGSIVGHKDLDPRPAYIRERCSRPGCAFYADADGRPYHRRVDPPEGLFAALQTEGIEVPRPPAADSNLLRAEAMTTRAHARTAP